jgi:hypothetical protein
MVKGKECGAVGTCVKNLDGPTYDCIRNFFPNSTNPFYNGNNEE